MNNAKLSLYRLLKQAGLPVGAMFRGLVRSPVARAAAIPLALGAGAAGGAYTYSKSLRPSDFHAGIDHWENDRPGSSGVASSQDYRNRLSNLNPRSRDAVRVLPGGTGYLDTPETDRADRALGAFHVDDDTMSSISKGRLTTDPGLVRRMLLPRGTGLGPGITNPVQFLSSPPSAINQRVGSGKMPVAPNTNPQVGKMPKTSSAHVILHRLLKRAGDPIPERDAWGNVRQDPPAEMPTNLLSDPRLDELGPGDKVHIPGVLGNPNHDTVGGRVQAATDAAANTGRHAETWLGDKAHAAGNWLSEKGTQANDLVKNHVPGGWAGAGGIAAGGIGAAYLLHHLLTRKSKKR